ncbi:hypothetical protein [Christensenella minuta]|uniref:hypothetical protein n=1 Tax=Christensenella minuta TaxID=626937 RepID=UPI0021588A35|nr:hypothetical protein [Christensenella minuta]
MKIIFGDEVFEGTPSEIIDQFRRNTFDNSAFVDAVSFLQYMKDTFERMTDMPCALPKGTLDERAEAMLRRLADIDALEIISGD